MADEPATSKPLDIVEDRIFNRITDWLVGRLSKRVSSKSVWRVPNITIEMRIRPDAVIR